MMKVMYVLVFVTAWSSAFCQRDQLVKCTSYYNQWVEAQEALKIGMTTQTYEELCDEKPSHVYHIDYTINESEMYIESPDFQVFSNPNYQVLIMPVVRQMVLNSSNTEERILLRDMLGKFSGIIENVELISSVTMTKNGEQIQFHTVPRSSLGVEQIHHIFSSDYLLKEVEMIYNEDVSDDLGRRVVISFSYDLNPGWTYEMQDFIVDSGNEWHANKDYSDFEIIIQ